MGKKKTYSKKYILFPKLSLKHLLFLFFFIISISKKIGQTYFEKNHRIAIEFLQLYMSNLGDMLTIIPYLIMKKRIGKEKGGIDNNLLKNKTTKGIEYIFNEEDEEDKKDDKTFRNVFIITVVDFIAQIGPVIYYIVIEGHKLSVKQVNLNTTLIFNIIFIIIFSICILHTKFYRHNRFSFSLDIFCLIILAIIDIKKIYEDHGDNITMSIIYLLIKITSEVLYSFENVLAKYIFLYNFVTTYQLLLVKSLFHFLYLILFSFPFIFIKLHDEDGESKNVFYMIITTFEEKKYYVIVISYIIISFFYNNLIFKIIDIFSANHFTMARLFENFGIFILDLVINEVDKGVYLVIRIIMYIILVLASFIYNEFLVVNICGLSKKTKLFMDYEAEKEYDFNKEDGEKKMSMDSSEQSISVELFEGQLKEVD